MWYVHFYSIKTLDLDSQEDRLIGQHGYCTQVFKCCFEVPFDEPTAFSINVIGEDNSYR